MAEQLENQDEITTKTTVQETDQTKTTDEKDTDLKEENSKPSLLDNVEPDETDETESDEEEFDYSKILGDEFEDKDKEKVDNLREKYKDPDELLKALYNANKMIGQKKDGAPESYEFEKAEDLDMDINEDVLESFNELAKENGLSNDQYNSLVNNFAKQSKDIYDKAIEAERENIKSEIDSIDNFETRASALMGKAKNILEPEDFKVLTDNVHSKQHFEVLEKIINSTKNSGINTNVTEQTRSDLQSRASELTTLISKEGNNSKRDQMLKERRDIYTKLQD